MRPLILATRIVAALVAGACAEPGGLVPCVSGAPVDVGSPLPTS